MQVSGSHARMSAIFEIRVILIFMKKNDAKLYLVTPS